MPSYKVMYFDLAGRAETMRMLLKYGNIPFVDQRIDKADWPKIKPTTPFGKLPILEMDGVMIPQSEPIFRYLANEVGLAGKDNRENLAIDVAVATLEDLNKQGIDIWHQEDPKKKKEMEKQFKEELTLYLGKFEERAKKNGGYIALNRLSWADIFFINIYEFLRMLLPGEDVLASYPNLQQVKKNVLSIASIRDWIKNRPKGILDEALFNLKQDV